MFLLLQQNVLPRTVRSPAQEIVLVKRTMIPATGVHLEGTNRCQTYLTAIALQQK